MIFEKVAELIKTYKDEEDMTIKTESTFQELGLDSLDTVELVMSLESEFDVMIEMSEDIKTVGDVVKNYRDPEIIRRFEMIKTPLCDLLDIEYPILQGGMAWIADASLAAAVSNGGGLGIIAAMNADAEWLRAEIKEVKTLTSRPFGVNIMLMSPFC